MSKNDIIFTAAVQLYSTKKFRLGPCGGRLGGWPLALP